jgi:hypothetical protein
MTEKKTEEQAALEAADHLEQLARDLREGRVSLEHYEQDVGFNGAIPTGEVNYHLRVRAVAPERRGAIIARVDGITIGPVRGFDVEALGGERVELRLRCVASYDEVETLARYAGTRARTKGRAIPGGDVGGTGG